MAEFRLEGWIGFLKNNRFYLKKIIEKDIKAKDGESAVKKAKRFLKKCAKDMNYLETSKLEIKLFAVRQVWEKEVKMNKRTAF